MRNSIFSFYSYLIAFLTGFYSYFVYDKWMSTSTNRILGESKAMARVFEQVSRAAQLDRPILVVGERGTGKELIAARLHFLSRRWDQPYVKINCGAFSEGILESELFGHEAGAFTGATKRQLGRFERANGGSLFLDELGNLPLAAQERMLRVIEYGEFERVGGQQLIQIDARLIAATNEHLPDRVATGEFRGDLLDRLTFDVISLPPLRDRGHDVLQLAHHFGIRMAAELGLDGFPGWTPEAEASLLAYPWPGNVRELKHVIERNLYQQDDFSKPIAEWQFDPFSDPASVPPERARASAMTQPTQLITPSSEPLDLKHAVIELERQYLLDALTASRWHQAKAAETLGLTYHQLRALLRKYPDIRKP